VLLKNMLSEKQVISFYYPTPNVGGAQLLFARIAEQLQGKGFRIRVYERTECFISNFLKKKNIDFEIVRAKNSGKFVGGTSETFLLSLSFITLIFKEFQFNDSSKFIFWDLHTHCLLDQTAFSGVYKKIANASVRTTLIRLLDYQRRKKINSLIEIGTKKNGVLFMCNYNYQYNKETFKFKNKVDLLPIPVETNSFENKSIQDDNRYIRIGWISRLERDKNNILTLLIDDIAKTNLNISLTIIGSGSDERYIKDYIVRSNLNNVNFAGKIEPEDISSFLSKNIDIGFSMGTAALEFALRKIPTVLVPATIEFKYFLPTNERYEWLHKIGGYDVCTYWKKNMSYKTFESILNDFIIHKQSLKEESYLYVLKNHGVETVVEDLIKIIDKCVLRLSSLKQIGLLKNNGFETIAFLLKRIYKKIKQINKNLLHK
jgi:hypothetical protein